MIQIYNSYYSFVFICDRPLYLKKPMLAHLIGPRILSLTCSNLVCWESFLIYHLRDLGYKLLLVPGSVLSRVGTLRLLDTFVKEVVLTIWSWIVWVILFLACEGLGADVRVVLILAARCYRCVMHVLLEKRASIGNLVKVHLRIFRIKILPTWHWLCHDCVLLICCRQILQRCGLKQPHVPPLRWRRRFNIMSIDISVFAPLGPDIAW